MIRFERVTVTYDGARRAALTEVDLDVAEGELCAVVGRTGSGKSTLLGACCGLVPHFTGGHVAGRVTVGGRDTRDHRPRDLADVVGTVAQDPTAGFVAERVEDELAYGMEQLGLAPATMRRRVEEVLDLLGIAELRSRPLRTLSGGQQQRVAIGSALCAHPRVLVLDEPSSALDPTAAEDVLAAIARLVHDLGVTVLVAEHRMERVAQFADSVAWLPGDGSVVHGRPAAVLGEAGAGPPVLDLGQLVGWRPLPLSVRDARRRVGPLRDALRGRPMITSADRTVDGDDRATLLEARDVVVTHGPVVAVRQVSLALRAGEVLALMGRNGAGKSSLLWALQGSGARQGGSVRVATPVGLEVRPTASGAGRRRRRGGATVGTVTTVDAIDPATLPPDRRRRLVGLVPQDPGDLLYLATVAEELDIADREAGVPAGTARSLLDGLVGGVDDSAHPRDLSEGQRLALVLAVQLAAAPTVVLLDEPTRGLDHAAKARLAINLRRLAVEGRAVVLSTHDVEVVAHVADRVVLLAEGEVIADGPTAEVVSSSPSFAPQVARVLHPEPWLTVDQVALALAGDPS